MKSPMITLTLSESPKLEASVNVLENRRHVICLQNMKQWKDVVAYVRCPNLLIVPPYPNPVNFNPISIEVTEGPSEGFGIF